MSLVKMKELLERAQKNNIGCGAFSVGNMEMVRGAIQAAEELDTPIILQIAEVRLKHFSTSSNGTNDGSGCKRSESRCCSSSGSWSYI